MSTAHAFVPVPVGNGWILGRADHGTSGYTPVAGPAMTCEAARAEALRRNRSLGLSEAQVDEIVIDTMRKR